MCQAEDTFLVSHNKSKIDLSVVSLIALNSSGCCPAIKSNECHSALMESKLLHHVRYEGGRQVASDIVLSCNSCWQNSLAKIGYDLEVNGKWSSDRWKWKQLNTLRGNWQPLDSTEKSGGFDLESQPVTGANAKQEEVSFLPLSTYEVQKQLHNKNRSEGHLNKTAFVKLDVSSAEWHSFKC